MTTLDTLNSAASTPQIPNFVALLKAGADLGRQVNPRLHITSGKDAGWKSEWSRSAVRWYSALAINVEMYLDRALIVAQSTVIQ